MSGDAHWWGTYSIPEGEARYWRIGGLDLFVARRSDGWLVQYLEHRRDEAEEPPLEIARLIDWLPENSTSDVVQYKTGRSNDLLELTPLLADRPVVSRPRTPFNIAPDTAVTVYVGTPLWVALRAGAARTVLCELPLMRPPQTWFGTSNWEGALCYAGLTRCRTDADEVPLRPWRAVSPLLLTNHGKDGWLLDRVALPVPQLPLYASPDGRLWTSSLATTRDAHGDVGDIGIGKSEPAAAGPWMQQGEPRKTGSTSILGRFYGNLF